MKALVRLYPRQWRRRYGDELAQLVGDLGSSRSRSSVAVDLIKGALSVHMRQVVDMAVLNRRVLLPTAAIAAIVWFGLSVVIFLSNVVFPTKGDDDTIPVLIGYASIFAAMFLAGLISARRGASRWGQVAAGAIAGALIGLLTIGTFALVDNVWLDIVSQQQTKIDGFARSGASSMRAYINQGLLGGAIGLPLGLGFFGTLFGLAGGLAAGQSSPPAAPRSSRS